MEVKINKEIRDYTESVYFGLSLRQFIFSILACGKAVVLYFVFRPYFGIETLSWLCILGAAPFAAIGFIKYNELYESYENGEISYSLQPNIDINIGNVLGMLSSFYSYRGALGIYERDLQQPIYGV